ncbi:MAG TPA: hypothetical protein GXZ87_08900 [Bacteroidales bacterium]|nr:hypothetical protein [Bacteroidales bacterium]
MKRKFKYLALLMAFLGLFACGNKNRFQIDTDKNRVEMTIKRFDKDLIQLDTLNLASSVELLQKKYPQFLSLFIENMTNSEINDRDTIGKILTDFVNYPLVQDVNQHVLDKFSDISGVENELSDAFTYIHHYFPNLTLPEIYFYVSGLNVPMLMNADRSILGVGTDFYLGADFEPYKELVYDYMLQNMESDRLPIDIVSAVIFSNFQFDSQENRLLDNMIFKGKVLYLISVFMPNRTANEIVGYTLEQAKWAETHEKEIWRAIIAQKDLFSSDQHLIRKYMQEAPFTAPISQDSPGCLGEWIGLRIVEKYMSKNKDVTLLQLMKTNNYQEILQNSEY